MATITCTSQISYGSQLTCWAASTDVNDNFAEAGTFTFDKANALGATWTPKTCYVNDSECEVNAVLATPPGAQPRTVKFVVGFKGADGATVSTTISVQVVLRPTVTTLVCDSINLHLAGSTHCEIEVADQLYDWDSRPAQLGSGMSGLTVTSSAPGDTIVYDKPARNGSTCVAGVVGGVLACGLTLTADQVQGLRALTATYPGDRGGRRAAEHVDARGGQRAADRPDGHADLPRHRAGPQPGGQLSGRRRRSRPRSGAALG